ncbi:hypothetical protein [Rhizobium sp. AAP43]|uniref:hypothetical protein n=1 Tax=Rhizobium sp. AAP43 TaxID=1523420 RepID=UPI0018D01A6A|nr:hypothetical protein [Rhizobium sp. AAP43]
MMTFRSSPVMGRERAPTFISVVAMYSSSLFADTTVGQYFRINPIRRRHAYGGCPNDPGPNSMGAGSPPMRAAAIANRYSLRVVAALAPPAAI